jgi:hypothetical protein
MVSSTEINAILLTSWYRLWRPKYKFLVKCKTDLCDSYELQKICQKRSMCGRRNYFKYQQLRFDIRAGLKKLDGFYKFPKEVLLPQPNLQYRVDTWKKRLRLICSDFAFRSVLLYQDDCNINHCQAAVLTSPQNICHWNVVRANSVIYTLVYIISIPNSSYYSSSLRNVLCSRQCCF